MNVYFFQNFATLKAQLVRPWRRQIRLELLSCYLLGPTAVVNNNVEVAQLIPLISRLSCQKIEVQLNKYETAPNFNQISQNLTSDCLLI